MYLDDLQQDEVFVPTEIKSLEELTGLKPRRGLENAIVSNDKIVNVVSKSYGHIPNELFFKKAEQMFIDAGLNYVKRTINRNDRSFVMELIIKDGNEFFIKNDKDAILPMLRLKNSYDSRDKTAGHFGFYRRICSNGLHVSDAHLEFSLRHTKNGIHLLIPRLTQLFEKFLDNEYYTITRKFKRLKEVKIIDTKKFVEQILERTQLFRYECSDTNPDPSKKSRQVIEIIDNESILLNEPPNLWLGYNAFNSVLHNNMKKSFSNQEKLDRQLFDEIYEMV